MRTAMLPIPAKSLLQRSRAPFASKHSRTLLQAAATDVQTDLSEELANYLKNIKPKAST